MSTRKSRAPAAAPTASDAKVDFYVADDVRIEEGGKVTLVGMYPDRVVVALVPHDAPEPSTDVPLAIDGLAFLVNIRNLVGDHRVSVEIGKKPGTPAWHSFSFATPETSANLVARARPFSLASYGTKEVSIKIDDSVFHRYFEVRRGSIPSIGTASKGASPTAVSAPIPDQTRSEAAPRSKRSRPKA